MVSTYSPPGHKSTLERLREACKNTADAVAHERRNVINEASSLALEIHETQQELIAKLEEELKQWKLRCAAVEEHLVTAQFEVRNLRAEKFKEKFPMKGKKRG